MFETLQTVPVIFYKALARVVLQLEEGNNLEEGWRLMKSVTVLITDWCPHCKRAIAWIDEVKQENPKYKDIKVEIIDEEKNPAIAKQYNYYYVPTYYVEKRKIFEGGTTKDIVRKVFEEAIKN